MDRRGRPLGGERRGGGAGTKDLGPLPSERRTGSGGKKATFDTEAVVSSLRWHLSPGGGGRREGSRA